MTIYSVFNNIKTLNKTKLKIDVGVVEKMRLSLEHKYMIGLKTLNITQCELAQELGFTRNYVNMLVNGKRKNPLFDKWMEINVLPLFKNKRSLKK